MWHRNYQLKNLPSSIIVLLFLFVLLSINMGVSGFIEEVCTVNFQPYQIHSIKENNFFKITINSTCTPISLQNTQKPQYAFYKSYLKRRGQLFINVESYNKHVIRPSLIDYRSLHPEVEVSCQTSRWCILLNFDYKDQNFFYIHANQVGISKLLISLVRKKKRQPRQTEKPRSHVTTNKSLKNRSSTNKNSGIGNIQTKNHHNSSVLTNSSSSSASSSSLLSKYEYIPLVNYSYTVKVLRNYRKFHTVFDYSATFIASLTAFSVGCTTEISFLTNNFKSPKALLVSLICQHLIMPLITIAVSAALRLPTQLAFGLCAMSALPGGGLAHLIVVLINGDRPLSTAISIMNTIMAIVFLSLWLLFFSWFYSLNTYIEYIIIWIFPGVIAHSAGFFINKLRPPVAQALLTWFSRPILLLSAILLMTLGVYVNHYAFHYIDYQLVSGLCLVIFGGYCIGGLAGLLVKLPTEHMKSIAAENSVFNCLLLIPALRYAMEAPHGDLAAAVPLWGVFFTPAPIILYFVVHRIKVLIVQFVERRRRKQSQHFSIVTSLAKMAEGMSAVSAPITMNSTGHHLPLSNFHAPPNDRSSEPSTVINTNALYHNMSTSSSSHLLSVTNKFSHESSSSPSPGTGVKPTAPPLPQNDTTTTLLPAISTSTHLVNIDAPIVTLTSSTPAPSDAQHRISFV